MKSIIKNNPSKLNVGSNNSKIMKRFVLFFLLFSACVIHAEAKKIKGIIIFNREAGPDTVHTVFRVPTGLISGDIKFEQIQWGITYYEGSVKKKLKPKLGTSLQFEFEGRQIQLTAYHNSIGLWEFPYGSGDCIFLRAKRSGKLTLLSYCYMRSNSFNPSGTPYRTFRYLLYKKNIGLTDVKGFRFRKRMGEYFADCPTLVEKIQAKEFKYKHLVEIVDYYNKRCGSK